MTLAPTGQTLAGKSCLRHCSGLLSYILQKTKVPCSAKCGHGSGADIGDIRLQQSPQCKQYILTKLLFRDGAQQDCSATPHTLRWRHRQALGMWRHKTISIRSAS